MDRKWTFWFVTGSQNLYGPETLAQVDEDGRRIAAGLDASAHLPFRIVPKPVLTSAEEIRRLVLDANSDDDCAGLVVFMHTFSPSKMWITGLDRLDKPYCHLHTQFNREIPDLGIDMDFMNLHQSAHGDREHGFIGARLRMSRKIIAGYWEDETVLRRLGDWMRVAVGAVAGQSLRVMRFGDNMREVAVTEGDKVEAQRKLGWQVNTWAPGELARRVDAVGSADIDRTMNEYVSMYDIATEDLDSVRYQARIECAMEAMLREHGCEAFSATFEDLSGMRQLPGLATQRLMGKGFGFAGEGDWKTAALMRVMKIIGGEGGGGTSFMEDYTYDLTPGRELVLGAHMLEVCPSIAAGRPRIEVHPLGIGDREPPARLVFEGHPGSAVLASLIDMGGRMRLIVQDIEAVEPVYKMPNLPVARIMWKPMPDLMTGAEAWITAGGAHHTVLSFDVSAEQLRDWARIQQIEFVHIDADTRPERLERELFLSDLAWKLG
ncbi:MAG: L-arabinose isomerase [Clostridiaceae bacterium]|nr:L-arabinose isomerase [Clostridiaceae bacterium]